jgi:hypothetical protein
MLVAGFMHAFLLRAPMAGRSEPSLSFLNELVIRGAQFSEPSPSTLSFSQAIHSGEMTLDCPRVYPPDCPLDWLREAQPAKIVVRPLILSLADRGGVVCRRNR